MKKKSKAKTCLHNKKYIKKRIVCKIRVICYFFYISDNCLIKRTNFTNYTVIQNMSPKVKNTDDVLGRIPVYF